MPLASWTTPTLRKSRNPAKRNAAQERRARRSGDIPLQILQRDVTKPQGPARRPCRPVCERARSGQGSTAHIPLEVVAVVVLAPLSDDFVVLIGKQPAQHLVDHPHLVVSAVDAAVVERIPDRANNAILQSVGSGDGSRGGFLWRC